MPGSREPGTCMSAFVDAEPGQFLTEYRNDATGQRLTRSVMVPLSSA